MNEQLSKIAEEAKKTAAEAKKKISETAEKISESETVKNTVKNMEEKLDVAAPALPQKHKRLIIIAVPVIAVVVVVIILAAIFSGGGGAGGRDFTTEAGVRTFFENRYPQARGIQIREGNFPYRGVTQQIPGFYVVITWIENRENVFRHYVAAHNGRLYNATDLSHPRLIN